MMIRAFDIRYTIPILCKLTYKYIFTNLTHHILQNDSHYHHLINYKPNIILNLQSSPCIFWKASFSNLHIHKLINEKSEPIFNDVSRSRVYTRNIKDILLSLLAVASCSPSAKNLIYDSCHSFLTFYLDM